jgi:hypothetical protein
MRIGDNMSTATATETTTTKTEATVKTIRVKNGKVTVKQDNVLLSVEVDPAANGRLVTFNGVFTAIEGTEFTDSEMNHRARADFQGEISLVPQLAIPGLRSDKKERGA